jgi:outer membrane protein OmpA-like peptidoglycan-associated protein
MIMSKPMVPISIIVLAVASLTACVQPANVSCEPSKGDNSAQVSKEIVVVLAPNKGFLNFENVIASTTPLLQDIFTEKTNASFTIVLADGSPEIESRSVIDVEKFGTLQTDIDEEVENALREVDKVYRCALGLDGVSSSSTNESNLALALSKAAGAFKPAGTEKQIFVLSNGLSTSGQVDFTESQDGAPTLDDYENRVDDLAPALINLNSAKVSWIGLGQTDGDYQKSFDTQGIDALVKFWTLYVERSNGVASSINQGNVVADAPHESSLLISQVDPAFKKVCVSKDLGKDEGVVFKENSVEFKNDSIARESIEEVANQIIRSSCIGQVLVTGYVSLDADESSPDRIGDKDLSKRRANAVGEVLIEFGVPTEKIKTDGAGWGGFDEWDPDGTYNNELGEKNRIVKIQEQE